MLALLATCVWWALYDPGDKAISPTPGAGREGQCVPSHF